MNPYSVHTLDTAPAGSRPHLRALQEGIGMIPNLAASMAESPALLEGFVRIRQIQANGTFKPEEIQVLSLTNAFENGCDYCVALHSALALKEGVSLESVDALRAGRSPAEPHLKALSELSRKLVRQRGGVTQDDLAAFHGAGYTRTQALEVVLGVAVSILPNFAHHLVQAPLDEAFQAQRWNAPGR